MKDRPFALLGINSDTDLERTRERVTDMEITWRSFQNRHEGRESSISEDWSVSGWPTLVVLDENMRMRYRGHSFEPAHELAEHLVKALEARRKKQD